MLVSLLNCFYGLKEQLPKSPSYEKAGCGAAPERKCTSVTLIKKSAFPLTFQTSPFPLTKEFLPNPSEQLLSAKWPACAPGGVRWGEQRSPSPVLRTALCETSSLNLNSGEESLRCVETELVVAAINTRLQGSQRPCKCPTQPKLRTHWRCWDAKNRCVGANLCALMGQVIFSPPLSSVKKTSCCEPGESCMS